MKEETAKKLNDILAGERSAAETYQKAIANLDSSDKADELRMLRRDHHQAVETLRHEIVRSGFSPDETSGAWGAFAKVAMGTANMLGDRAALSTLIAGEEYGLEQYREIASDKEVPDHLRYIIENHFIPRQHRHISTLSELERQVA